MIRVTGVTAAICLAAQPAAAQREWSQDGWTGIRLGQACMAKAVFEAPGKSELTLMVAPVGIALGDTNAGWDYRSGRRYDVTVLIDDFAISGSVEGVKIGGKPGVTAVLQRADLARFATASWVEFFVGGKRIDRLSLAGSATAVAHVRECL